MNKSFMLAAPGRAAPVLRVGCNAIRGREPGMFPGECGQRMARPRIGPSPRKPRRAAPTRTFVLGAYRTPKADEGIGPGLGPLLFYIKRELDIPSPPVRRLASSPYFFQPRFIHQAKRLQRGPSEKPEGRGDATGRAKKNGIAPIVTSAILRRAARTAPESIEDAKEGLRASQTRKGRGREMGGCP